MSRAFEVKLTDYLDRKSKLTAQDRRLSRILELPRNRPRRKRVLGNVERTAAEKLSMDAGGLLGAIDWTSLLPKEFRVLMELIGPLIKAILSLFDTGGD